MLSASQSAIAAIDACTLVCSGGAFAACRVSLSLLCGFTPIVTHLPRPRVRSTRERRDAATLIVPHVDQQLAKQVLNDRDEPAEK